MPKIVALLFLVLFIVGIGLAVRAVVKGIQAKSWPVVPGRVLSSEVSRSVTRSRDRGTRVTWQPQVFYEYEVGGEKYTADKVANISFSSSNRRSAYKTIHKYPVGKEVDVYHNPMDPTDVMLEPGASFGSVVLVLLLVGFLFVATTLFLSAQKQEAVTTSGDVQGEIYRELPAGLLNRSIALLPSSSDR